MVCRPAEDGRQGRPQGRAAGGGRSRPSWPTKEATSATNAPALGASAGSPSDRRWLDRLIR